MCANVTTDPSNYFSNINGNLTKIVWAHAVNSKAELSKALASDSVMMLEADVVLGKWNSSENQNVNETIPVMAHPPATESDLSLEKFVSGVNEKNATKGVKLDFKSIEAFNASKSILDKLLHDLKFPVFLNADILAGPVNATATPVDAKAFLALAKPYRNCTVSVGWTTRYGTKDNVTEGGYTEEQIKKMIDTLKEQNVTQPITYPVRAGLAANDISVIKSLMEKSSDMKNVTLTVWSSEGDKVDAAKLSTLIKDIGVTKVYVDVPEDLMKSLQLSGSSSGVSVASITLVASLVAVLLSTIL
ncbi:Protein FAM151B [Habropoda laboriosa]|uniref:Protein FAM151B n=2 Tax=Habropoda laboriosa TaxID=597456 RepID=A0A0L7RE72_9HYME|nr:Protein FAM151B [Habropoda laboriosa]